MAMNQQELIEQSMLAQRSYLDIVRRRHHQWACATDDPEFRRLHMEIAESIQKTMDQYYDLLNAYHAATSSLSPIRSDIFTFHSEPISNYKDA
jgi:hypothetical protein